MAEDISADLDLEIIVLSPCEVIGKNGRMSMNRKNVTMKHRTCVSLKAVNLMRGRISNSRLRDRQNNDELLNSKK